MVHSRGDLTLLSLNFDTLVSFFITSSSFRLPRSLDYFSILFIPFRSYLLLFVPLRSFLFFFVFFAFRRRCRCRCLLRCTRLPGPIGSHSANSVPLAICIKRNGKEKERQRTKKHSACLQLSLHKIQVEIMESLVKDIAVLSGGHLGGGLRPHLPMVLAPQRTSP